MSWSEVPARAPERPRGPRAVAGVIGCGLMSLGSGCAILLGNPYADLGTAQDRHNAKVNAQYDPGLPAKLRTDYAARGNALDDGQASREWQEIFDLFRSHPARLPFRDEPSRCPEAGTYLSCSATQGCTCRRRSTDASIPSAKVPAAGESQTPDASSR